MAKPIHSAGSGALSYWPAYMLGAIGVVWMLQSFGVFATSLPFGPIAAVWASLTLILLIKQLKR